MGKAFFLLLEKMGVMTALLIAFTLGLGIASVEGTALKNVMNEFLEIIEKVVKGIVIPLLPLHIAGIFAGMAYSGEAEMVMATFFKVFIVILMLHFIMLSLQYLAAVVAALGLLASMLGFNEEMLGLMMALYMAQDSLGTACNVTGDGAIAILVNKVSGNKLEPHKEAELI